MKNVALSFALILGFVTSTAAQHRTTQTNADSSDVTVVHFVNEWTPLFGSFLEPNRFGTVYDGEPHYLRLEAGFGGKTLSIGRSGLGAECLIWSGLKSLSDFRFPVETADYFFGVYGVFFVDLGDLATLLRARISHISSHWVDGVKDSIVGGSSSRYSREFISLEGQTGEWQFGNGMRLRGSYGVRWIFHQVTHVEAPIHVLATAEFAPVTFGQRNQNELFLSYSDQAGAYNATQAVAVVLRLGGEPSGARMDIFGEYHFGKTRYGVKGELIENGFEAGIRVGKNLLLD